MNRNGPLNRLICKTMNRHFKILLAVTITWLMACQSHRPEYHDVTATISETTFKKDDKNNGCLDVLNTYCGKLYSADSSGNLLIKSKFPIQISQGESFNQLPQIFVKYAIAKIKNRNKLPPEFRAALNEYGYFDKLEQLLNRKPLVAMTLEERNASEYLEYELSSIWMSSIEQAVMTRMSLKYPGYHHISNTLMPIEYDVAARRIRRQVISDISKVLWREDKNWQKVVEGFNDLKSSFMALFDRLDVPADIAQDWRNKIAGVELVLPGSLPEISDEECSTTTINAYYYSHLNLITVCAGDFNSEDIILTLGHEMSHALDIDRALYLYHRDSELGQRMAGFRKQICAPSPVSRCDDWNQFKADLQGQKLLLSNFKPQLPEFQQCLKKTHTDKVLDAANAKRIAEKMATDRVSSMASSNLFLRLIKEKIPLKNGKLQKNPSFMNPCGYYLWTRNEESLDDDLYTLIFFTEEYQCSNQGPEEKLKSAIETARNMTSSLLAEVLMSEGEFSGRPELVAEGYSSPPFERFADVVGTYAVSEFLKKYDSVWDRRSKYLASSSWLCQEPSLDSAFPKESKIEKLFSLSSHAEGEDRKKEVLSEPIRQILSCQKDFEFHECHLPVKPAPH